MRELVRLGDVAGLALQGEVMIESAALVTLDDVRLIEHASERPRVDFFYDVFSHDLRGRSKSKNRGRSRQRNLHRGFRTLDHVQQLEHAPGQRSCGRRLGIWHSPAIG